MTTSILYGYVLTEKFVRENYPNAVNDDDYSDVREVTLNRVSGIEERYIDFAHTSNMESTDESALMVGIVLATTKYQYTGACMVPPLSGTHDKMLDELVEQNPTLALLERHIYAYGDTNK